MIKKLSRALSLFLALILSMPLGAFATLGVFAQTTDTVSHSDSLYTEPTLTNTTNVAYFSYTGKDTNSGLAANAMKKSITEAFALLKDGGRLVMPVKGYVGENTNVGAVNGTVLITAKDTDGTLYYDPASPDVDGKQTGMFMVTKGCSITFNSDVIFDDVVILQRYTNTTNSGNIAIAGNSTMLIGENVQFCKTKDGTYNTKLTVTYGSTLIVKTAGAHSYNGCGTIYIDRDLFGQGVDASQFSNFHGDIYDLDGNPMCDLLGHNIGVKRVDGALKNICVYCGYEDGNYTYALPTLTGSNATYWAATTSTAFTTVTGISTPTGGGGIVSAIKNGGTVYIVQKGYTGDNYTFNFGGTTKMTAVLPDSFASDIGYTGDITLNLDQREVNIKGETVEENGAIMAPGGKDIIYTNDMIFENVNFYGRSTSATVYTLASGTTALFDGVNVKTSKDSYVKPTLNITASATAIMLSSNVGSFGKIVGKGTLVIDKALVDASIITAATVADFEGSIMTLDYKEICELSGSHSYVDGVCKNCGADENTKTVFYLSASGTGDGLTPEAPASSLKECFKASSANDIEIILVDDLKISNGIICEANSKNITITSMDADGDGVMPKLIIQSYIIFKNSGAANTITFENIEIQSDRSGSVPMFFEYNNFTFGEGVSCTLSGNYPDTAEYPIIYVGFLTSSDSLTVKDRTNSYNTTATIASGTWTKLVGGTRRDYLTYAFGNTSGDLTINITGGSFLGDAEGVALSGTGSNFYSGNIDINISGGSILGGIYGVGDLGMYGGAAPYGAYGLKGNITIDITGGTLGGNIYAKYPSTALAALIRGDVKVNIGADVTLNSPIMVDLRSTLAYSGQSKLSSLTYGSAHSAMIGTKFVDVVNGTLTGDGEPRRIGFVGDSITQGTGSTNRALYSAPANIQRMLDGESPDSYMVGNFGVGASGVFETAGYFYNETLQYHLLMEEFEPEWVSFALGTNDCQTAGGSAGAALRFEELYYSLIKGVYDLPSVNKVYVNTPIIRFDYLSAWSRNVSIIEPAIRNVVSKLKASGVDATLIEMGAISAAETLAGNILGNDNLHPGNSGYVILAQFYYDAIFCGKVDAPDGFYLDTVYLSSNGTRTGAGTLESPISDLALAMARIKKSGGSIIILDSYTTPITLDKTSGEELFAYADIATPKDITGTLTIKGYTKDVVFEWRGKTFELGCDTVFDSITLRTVYTAPYLNGHFNSVTFTDTFKTATTCNIDLTYLVGHYVQKDMLLVDTTTTKVYDTAESVSSSKDIIININGGTFADIHLLNRRYNASAPFGMYSGNMTVNFNGGRISGRGESTMISAAMTMSNLSGSITVNFGGTVLDVPFYAISRTATLQNVTHDSSLNTGSVIINATASLLEAGKIKENQRTNTSDAQYTSVKTLIINNATVSGDIDEDGVFTNADVALMVRYLAGWKVSGASLSADVNNDNKINNRDAMALIKVIAFTEKEN